MLTNFGSGTVGPEVMAQSPGPHLQFGGAPVTVESPSREEPAGHWLHQPVNHGAGPIGLRVIESQDKAFGFGNQFFNGL